MVYSRVVAAGVKEATTEDLIFGSPFCSYLLPMTRCAMFNYEGITGQRISIFLYNQLEGFFFD